MGCLDDFRMHLLSSVHGSIEIVNFEPQQDAVAIGFRIGIADGTMVMFDIPAVKLEDQLIIRDQPFIFPPAVRALTAKETLIPPATCFDVFHRNERLRTHENLYVSRPRRADQPPGPETESPCGNCDENVPWICRQVRLFFDDTPEMRQGQQAKEHAGGHDIGLHGIPFRCEVVLL